MRNAKEYSCRSDEASINTYVTDCGVRQPVRWPFSDVTASFVSIIKFLNEGHETFYAMQSAPPEMTDKRFPHDDVLREFAAMHRN